MKWNIHPALILNGLLALWFFYHAALHGIAYALNRLNAQSDSPAELFRNLFPALVLAGLSTAALWMMKNPVLEKAAVILAWSPILLGFVYFCWMIVLLGSSGGRWN